jgi:Flp pilus assembly pilin Flp
MLSKLQVSVLKVYLNTKTFVGDEGGQDLIEYAVLCALVASVAIAATSNLANIIAGVYTAMGTAATNAINAA